MLIVHSNDYFILWCHGFLSCLQSVRETLPWMHMDQWRSTLPIAFLGGAHLRSISQTFSRTMACGSSMCLFHFSGHGHILVLLFFSLAWRYFLHVDRISKTKKQTNTFISMSLLVGSGMASSEARDCVWEGTWSGCVICSLISSARIFWFPGG